MRGVILFLAAVNLLAFLLYGEDKRRARKGKFRIRERTLLLAACAGGAAGSLAGMLFFRHKIRKSGFFLTVLLFFLLQWSVLLYISWKYF
ncbi:DUF1294 domain-containing protein [Mediterraneibacter massiliensis]|jgi:uncharacterized membrane protein YsdA (DUF1294 family)|uniref:DUF1294 domain-containing protein n=1 Tax=Mediterraneibacter massiliensis TaxID=1720300 RepID=UPI000E4B5693|nr:DUF1294 domain-containing protein [Mediterraneibacter massiliensis]RGT72601.1 DUF1294 domain-containing protein [Ruminococcus sp. AF18-22]